MVKAPKITDRSSITPVYVYFDGNMLSQCATYDLIIRPDSVNISTEINLQDQKLMHKHRFVLFDRPKPPENVEVLNYDMEKATLLLQWQHLKCYQFYQLILMTDGNSTIFLNQTVDEKDFLMAENNDADDMINYEIDSLQPCTAYTFLMRSGSDKELSVDQTGFVYFTRHADYIQLKAFADYHQVSIYL